jgi:membrane protein involved in colicin uptake
LNVDDIPIKP